MALLWKSCSIPYLLLYKKLLQDSGLKQQRTFIILIVSEIGDLEPTKLGESSSESLMRLCDLTPTLVDVQPELEEPVPGWFVHMAGKLVLAVGGGAWCPLTQVCPRSTWVSVFTAWQLDSCRASDSREKESQAEAILFITSSWKSYSIISFMFCSLEWVIKIGPNSREGKLVSTFWREECKQGYRHNF